MRPATVVSAGHVAFTTHWLFARVISGKAAKMLRRERGSSCIAFTFRSTRRCGWRRMRPWVERPNAWSCMCEASLPMQGNFWLSHIAIDGVHRYREIDGSNKVIQSAVLITRVWQGVGNASVVTVLESFSARCSAAPFWSWSARWWGQQNGTCELTYNFLYHPSHSVSFCLGDGTVRLTSLCHSVFLSMTLSLPFSIKAESGSPYCGLCLASCTRLSCMVPSAVSIGHVAIWPSMGAKT